MSQFSISYSCGHNGTVNITGPNNAREGKAAWMARGVCGNCYKAQLAAEREAKSADPGREGWPALEGTDKQVSWAVALRRGFVKHWEEEATKYAAKDPGASAVVGAIIAEVLDVYTDSKWWIENRFALDYGRALDSATDGLVGRVEQETRAQQAVI